MRYTLLIVMMVFGTQVILAQNKYAISGTVRDKKTGEVMIGAAIVLKEKPDILATTNAYGFYSLSVDEGTYTFTFHYTGYDEMDTLIALHQNVRLDMEISEKVVSLRAFEVSSIAANKNITSTDMSMERINVKEISTIPVFLGERDILKT